MIISNHTEGSLKTCLISGRAIFGKVISLSDLSSSFRKNQANTPTKEIHSCSDISMTYLNAALLCETVASEISVVMNSEKVITPRVPKRAPTRPRPPSKKKPKALPWELIPPQTRVALIKEGQNKNIVVKPQYP